MGGVLDRFYGNDSLSYRERHPGVSDPGIFNWFNWWSAEGSDIRDPSTVPDIDPDIEPETDKETDGEDEPKPNGEDKLKPDKEENPQPKPEPKPKPQILKTKKVEFNVKVNTDAHHTSDYSITEAEEGQIPQLVVRRGQTFDIDIEFNRLYNPESDKVVLVFEFGKNPLPQKATHVEVALSQNDAKNKWGAKIQKTEENILSIRLNTPATIYVGKWKLFVDIIIKYVDKNIVYRYKDTQPIYILFNPWCKDDAVYHHDEELRKEYVLNESGGVFQGSARWPSKRSWNFAQFILPSIRGNGTVTITASTDATFNQASNDNVLISNILLVIKSSYLIEALAQRINFDIPYMRKITLCCGK